MYAYLYMIHRDIGLWSEVKYFILLHVFYINLDGICIIPEKKLA